MVENKEKLKMTLSDIEKVYGKGSVMKLGDKPKVDVDVISTGSMLLDNALGVGGYPKGRIVEIFGPEASGKCLTENNQILTSEGYKTIKEIFNENGLETNISTKTVEKTFPLVNLDGKDENTTHFTFNGKKKVFRVKTQQGTEIECTSNHPLKVLDSNGYVVWKQAKKIREGDILLGLKNTQRFGKEKCRNEIAYLLGILTADGSYQKNRISLTNDDNDVVKAFYKGVENEPTLSEANIKVYTRNKDKDNNSHDYRLCGAESIHDFYYKYELSAGNAYSKKVPNIIKRGTKKSQIEFLKGYFDCESYCDNSGIEVTSASKELLHYIRLMLKNLGIQSSIAVKNVKKYSDNTYYRLGVFSDDLIRFIDVIGTNSSKVKKRYDSVKEYKKTTISTIPNINKLCIAFYEDLDLKKRSRQTEKLISDIKLKNTNIQLKTLRKLLALGNENHLFEVLQYFNNENLTYEKVVSIEFLDMLPTYDFAMESTHTFICEGIINHNTTLTLHAIAECQKAGGTAAFIDAEHAINPGYAKIVGVDIDELILSQPDSGEQALEITQRLIESGAIDMVVVDSVAALVPQAELDGEMSDANIGLQARMMSKAMRKLSSIVSKNNCVLIFINQLREKVGIMFGNPEVTTGGKALKYFSTIRVDARKSEAIKKGADIIGNKMNIKVVKNKVSPPFKTCTLELIYGEGISRIGEVIELAVEYGIMDKSGSWFSYADEKIGQGIESAKAFLNANPDILKEIQDEIYKRMKNNQDA